MIENSINISIANLWQCWQDYKKGKKRSLEFECFYFNIEQEIFQLHHDLVNKNYKHGHYKNFLVTDNKRRIISTAPLRDRIIHRLLYNYLVEIFDKTLIYDAWSCRKHKGLHGAIQRTVFFMKKYHNCYIWRADIKKFFDNVDQRILFSLLCRKVNDNLVLELLEKVINSYCVQLGKGIPIGNLTSQIFSNIYLNELDRYIVHYVKPKAYLRYGDDFIIFEDTWELTQCKSQKIRKYISERLFLEINHKNDIILKAKHGLKFIGVVIYPNGIKINKRNQSRLNSRLNLSNVSSYYGLIKQCQSKKLKEFNYQLYNILNI